MTGERTNEASALDVLRDKEETNLLTAFRHIPEETKDIAYRTLTEMAEKAVRYRPNSSHSFLRIAYLTKISTSRRLIRLSIIEIISSWDVVQTPSPGNCRDFRNVINRNHYHSS